MIKAEGPSGMDGLGYVDAQDKLTKEHPGGHVNPGRSHREVSARDSHIHELETQLSAVLDQLEAQTRTADDRVLVYANALVAIQLQVEKYIGDAATVKAERNKLHRELVRVTRRRDALSKEVKALTMAQGALARRVEAEAAVGKAAVEEVKALTIEKGALARRVKAEAAVAKAAVEELRGLRRAHQDSILLTNRLEEDLRRIRSSRGQIVLTHIRQRIRRPRSAISLIYTLPRLLLQKTKQHTRDGK